MVVILNISFDDDTEYFYPGQLIQGTVTLTNSSEIKVKGLTLTFFGDAEVYWTEAEAIADTMSPHRNQGPTERSRVRRHVHKEFRNQETILCDEILLLGQGEAEGGTEFILKKETTEYPFCYKLPVGLPSTFTEFPYGSIRYSAEARLKRALFRYDKIEREFSVKGVVDISALPRTLIPFGVNQRVDLGWLCCLEGHISLDVEVHKTGFIPNESINFRVSAINSSTTLINHISAALTQEISFRTFDKTKTISSELRNVLYETPVEPNGIAYWNGSIIVPSWVPPSSLNGPRIIGFQYSIQVIAKTPDNLCKAVCPIFIGSETRDILHAFALTSCDVLSCANNEDGDTSTVNVDSDGIPTTTKKREYNPSLNPFLESESGLEREEEARRSAEETKETAKALDYDSDGLQMSV